jgi:hypothetical protein
VLYNSHTPVGVKASWLPYALITRTIPDVQ